MKSYDRHESNVYKLEGSKCQYHLAPRMKPKKMKANIYSMSSKKMRAAPAQTNLTSITSMDNSPAKTNLQAQMDYGSIPDSENPTRLAARLSLDLINFVD